MAAQSQMSGGEASSLGPVSDLYDTNRADRMKAAKLDQEFLDIDPCLKGLKGGYLMQRTFFNTKLGSATQSAKIGTTLTTRKSPTRFLASTIDMPSGRGDATTEAASSRTALQKTTRFGGQGAVGFGRAGAGPACNYQNVDLFKIPDAGRLGKKQRGRKT